MKIAKCDHCHKEDGMIQYYGWNLPDGWRDTQYGDLCSKCFKKYDEIVANFMNKQKERMARKK